MIDPKQFSRWTARVVPVFIVGIVAYVTYVIVGPLCVDYLLTNTIASPRRSGPAIAILVIYFILLFFFTITYLRIIHTLATDPGYVERSDRYLDSQKQQRQGSRKNKHVRKSSDREKGTKEKVVGADPITGHPYSQTIESQRPLPDAEQPGLEYFYNKNAFLCEGDGRPPWCTICLNWKPDRAHHCREVARCVKKMDHFCPWVGGIVSETNFKFFMQFVFYAALYCLFVLVVLAVFLAEYRGETGTVNPHFLVALVLGAFFFMFTAGMTGTTMRLILFSCTSVEDLSRTVKVWSIAVYLPNPPPPGTFNLPYQTITFPLPAQAQGERSPPPRTFAILHSKPGDNPFDLGAFNNFTDVMGFTIWDWMLPIRRSPSCDHSNGESDWQFGPVLQRMKEDYGLVEKRRRSRSNTHRNRPTTS